MASVICPHSPPKRERCLAHKELATFLSIAWISYVIVRCESCSTLNQKYEDYSGPKNCISAYYPPTATYYLPPMTYYLLNNN